MIHPHKDGTCSISSGGMWMTGTYASERAANYAFRFSDQVLSDLWHKGTPKGEIIRREPITFEELQEERRRLKREGLNQFGEEQK